LIAEGEKVRTCYIHIGGKKTGSTSIQFALKRNKDILNKFNFFIDDTLGAVEDKALAKWVMKPDEFNAKNRVEQYMENVRRAFLLGSQAAIISAESLTDLYIEEIESLYHLLRPLFDRFVVIMYVRRQDIVASSHYSTALKGGSTSKKLMSFGMGKRGGRPFSYGSIMHDWAKVFGQESLRIRRYVEKAEGQWDAVNDFLHLLPVLLST